MMKELMIENDLARQSSDASNTIERFASSNCAYVHNGSLEGLLSAVFLAFERHELPVDIVSEKRYQPRLGQESITIETDSERALRVRRGVEKRAGCTTFRAIVAASLCDDYDTGIAILRFIMYVMLSPQLDRKKGVLSDLANEAVARLTELQRRAANEAEKMRQFVRFSHLENGIWFARINPNVSVIPLIMGHFASRLNDQPFIIYDEVHELSGIYDGDSWQMVLGPVQDVANPMQHDRYMEEAWRSFYDSLCVDARYNPELRRNFMPVRYWKNLPEMKPGQRASL